MQTYLIDNSTRELSKKEKFESYKGKGSSQKKKKRERNSGTKIKALVLKVLFHCDVD